MIADQGLASHLEIQTATYIGAEPAVVKSAADVHLSELSGLAATLGPDGSSWLFRIYREAADPGGETKHVSIRQMITDKIAPVEMISVADHNYKFQTLDGKTETGTF
jgi:hypothetical protein